MICFVILHYMVRNETEACVRSLDKLEGEKSIVIVDNASSNGSGTELYNLYKDRDDIEVVINEENLGFANGNNLGCRIAEKKYKPDFFCVMNNDVEIPQIDFIHKVEDIFRRENFDILGPDIYSTTGKIHQSPKNLNRTTIEGAKRLLKDYEKKNKSMILVPLRCYLKRFELLKKVVNKRKNKAQGIDYSQKYYDVPLHGSCFVFSKKFIDERSSAFFDKTFFYYESEILDYQCQIEKRKVVYDPSIRVLHHQNIATNTIYKNELKKVRFMNLQNYNSIASFLQEYGKE